MYSDIIGIKKLNTLLNLATLTVLPSTGIQDIEPYTLFRFVQFIQDELLGIVDIISPPTGLNSLIDVVIQPRKPRVNRISGIFLDLF